MKITIKVDCPERDYRRSYEADFAPFGGKELFDRLVRIAEQFAIPEKKVVQPPPFNKELLKK